MEATGDWSQAEQVVKRVPLIVIEYHDLILEHSLNVLFCVEIKPIFQSEATELVIHLLLLEEVYLLRLLHVSLLVQADELEQ